MGRVEDKAPLPSTLPEAQGSAGSGHCWAVECKGLTKIFGSQRVLRGVDLRVRRGSLLIIFGPNGAGKTTLLRTLATLIKPSSGSTTIAGLDLAGDSVAVRRCLGAVLHQTLLYSDLTGHENLRFYGRMYDVPFLEQRIEEIAGKVGIAHRMGDQVRLLSRGMQQRLSIARALLHQPQVLLLDEPETGLDQQAATLFRQLLQEQVREGRTAVMTTHSLERGLELADEVAILFRGRVVFQAARESLDLPRFSETYQSYTQSGS